MEEYNTIQLLHEAGYPMLLDFKDIERCTGIAEKTLKNWHTQGKLPFKSRKYGGARKALIQDVAYWMETGESCLQKRKPGRPTASEAYRRKKQSEKSL